MTSTHLAPVLRLGSDGALDTQALANDPSGQPLLELIEQDDFVDELLRRAQARLNSWDRPVSKSWPCGAGLERIHGISAEYALLAQALDKERARTRELTAAMARAYAPKAPFRAI